MIITNVDIRDLSGDNPHFLVPMGTIIDNFTREDDHLVVTLWGMDFPLMLEEVVEVDDSLRDFFEEFQRANFEFCPDTTPNVLVPLGEALENITLRRN